MWYSLSHIKKNTTLPIQPNTTIRNALLHPECCCLTATVARAASACAIGVGVPSGIIRRVITPRFLP
jgi:hypothetical protein